MVAILDSIYIEDQKYRQQIDEIEKKFGRQSNEMREHWKVINEKDSINLIKVKSILDKYGWLGTDIIGGQGNNTLFLVIQHADIETQVQYLPMMREAVKNGKAKGSSLALHYDRANDRYMAVKLHVIKIHQFIMFLHWKIPTMWTSEELK